METPLSHSPDISSHWPHSLASGTCRHEAEVETVVESIFASLDAKNLMVVVLSEVAQAAESVQWVELHHISSFALQMESVVAPEIARQVFVDVEEAAVAVESQMHSVFPTASALQPCGVGVGTVGTALLRRMQGIDEKLRYSGQKDGS